MTVLILGGTGEARALAQALVEGGGRPIVSSLAGRVSAPTLPVGEVRIGGFGGPDGLAAWLREHQVEQVVDATHPFAAGISKSAAIACARTGTPLLTLRRSGWTAGPGDAWLRVPDLPAAADAVAGFPGPVFLTTGRGGLAYFAHLPQRFLIRAVDPPTPPLPADHEVLLSRGPYTLHGERELMDRHGIRLLVTKDSGGALTEAKLTAARERVVPVVVVDRPAPADPSIPVVADVAGAVAWVGTH